MSDFIFQHHPKFIQKKSKLFTFGYILDLFIYNHRCQLVLLELLEFAKQLDFLQNV